MTFLVALVCTLSFRIVGAALSDGDDGVDRANGDIAGMPVALHANDKPSVCSKMCGTTPACVCWAYTKPNCSGDGTVPTCYLKDTISKQSLNDCRVSWTMQQLYHVSYSNCLVPGFGSKECNFVAIRIQTTTNGNCKTSR